jgi:hypothetical protein
MTRLLAALAAAAIVTACATLPADPARQAAEVMAQAKAAAGGARLDRVTTFHDRGARVRDGTLNGTYEEWGDYRTMAYTVVETFGGVTTSGGFDGKVGWSRGPDGKVRLIEDPRQLMGTKLSGYLDVQGYFFPDRFPARFAYAGAREIDGKPCDVVTVTPKDGIPIDLWFDRKTHLLRRLTGRQGPVAIQGDIRERQTVEGIILMRTGLQTMTTPSGAHTESQQVESYVFGAVPPERLAPPG